METERNERDSAELVERLGRTIEQIVDATIRKHFLARRLSEMDDETVIEVLHLFQMGAIRGDAACQAVITSAVDAQRLREEFGKKRLHGLVAEAKKKNYAHVINLFRVIRPVKDPAGDENAFQQYGLSGMTLGERKSAARSLDRDLLNRVGYDLDNSVIHQLLLNPRLTEQDVVIIAARRPNFPEVLSEIYNSPKWRTRPQVRLALIRNPYTPPHLAIALVPTLLKQDLREVMLDRSIHADVRAAAENAWETKSGEWKKQIEEMESVTAAEVAEVVRAELKPGDEERRS
ncbi:MAG TPA: hypothetical protein PKW95_10790 [bacterium]|nr:hypothetical protein [bacterium]